MNYISFDIGGTQTKYAIITDHFNIIEKGIFNTNISLGVDQLKNSIINIINENKPYNIKGVAISSPGVIDNKTGIVLYANERMPNYIGYNFPKEILKETSLPCSVENDVNCFALSETLNNNHTFLMITVGTGIGGAVVINNEVYHGIDNSAGEFGQMILDNKKWEDLASIKSLLEKAKLFGLDVKNGEDVFILYDQHQTLATTLVDEFYNYLAKGICNLAYIFNPHKIIIGGGITKRGPLFKNEINNAIKKVVDLHYLGSTTIEISKNLNDGGIIGALIHHLNQKNDR